MFSLHKTTILTLGKTTEIDTIYCHHHVLDDRSDVMVSKLSNCFRCSRSLDTSMICNIVNCGLCRITTYWQADFATRVLSAKSCLRCRHTWSRLFWRSYYLLGVCFVWKDKRLQLCIYNSPNWYAPSQNETILNMMIKKHIISISRQFG